MTRWTAALAFVAIAAACAADLRPPCGADPVPSYPALGEGPAVQVLEREPQWTPPACTDWQTPGFSTLLAVAARFHGATSILQKVGAISELTGMQYFSTTHNRWQTLVIEAHALDGPTGNRRKDFTPEELTTGRTLYFAQEDNLTGKATYALHVLNATPDRLVFETENLTTLRYFMLPMFHPGDVQSVYFLTRDPETNDWAYYNLARTGINASPLTAGHNDSSTNRALAFYHHLAGIPVNPKGAGQWPTLHYFGGALDGVSPPASPPKMIFVWLLNCL